MGAFPVIDPRQLNQRKAQLVHKLMGRAMGGRAVGGGGTLFRGSGMMARGGRPGMIRADSTNPYAVHGLGMGLGHQQQDPGPVTGWGQYGQNPGAVGQPGAPVPTDVGSLDSAPSPADPYTGGGSTTPGSQYPSPDAAGVLGGPPPALEPYDPNGGGGGGNPFVPNAAGVLGGLIPMGDGRFFDPRTGSIVGGDGGAAPRIGGGGHGTYGI